MGREVWVEIRDKENKPVWSSVTEDFSDGYFCGRNDETGLLIPRIEETDEDCLVDMTDRKVFDQIYHDLENCATRSNHKYDKLSALYQDLLEARRHATTIENFNDFTEAAEEVDNDIQDTYWDRASDMIRAMHSGRSQLRKLCGFQAWDDDDEDVYHKSGYRLVWVVSE